MEQFTIERIDAYHNAIQDDFCNTEGHKFDQTLFGDYLLQQYPEYGDEIKKVIDHKFKELLDLKEIFAEDLDDEESTKGTDLFYNEFCDYMNVYASKEEKEMLERILILAQV